MMLRVDVPREQIYEFCRKWKIKELSIFGSALTAEFHEGSDIDILVAFDDDAEWSLMDFINVEEALRELFGRKVDLVDKNALRNPFRRHHILNHRQVLYAA